MVRRKLIAKACNFDLLIARVIRCAAHAQQRHTTKSGTWSRLLRSALYIISIVGFAAIFSLFRLAGLNMATLVPLPDFCRYSFCKTEGAQSSCSGSVFPFCLFPYLLLEENDWFVDWFIDRSISVVQAKPWSRFWVRIRDCAKWTEIKRKLTKQI